MMTYHELVKKVQLALAKADASKIEEHIAVQVNVTGEAEGAFYMEVANGSLFVCPYDYNDRDALLTIADTDILAIAEGKYSFQQAHEDGKLQLDLPHDKSLEKLLKLGDVIPAKKAAVKKTAAKKEEKAAEVAAPAAEVETAEEAPKKRGGRKCGTSAAEKKPATARKSAAKKSVKK